MKYDLASLRPRWRDIQSRISAALADTELIRKRLMEVQYPAMIGESWATEVADDCSKQFGELQRSLDGLLEDLDSTRESFHFLYRQAAAKDRRPTDRLDWTARIPSITGCSLPGAVAIVVDADLEQPELDWIEGYIRAQVLSLSSERQIRVEIEPFNEPPDRYRNVNSPANETRSKRVPGGYLAVKWKSKGDGCFVPIPPHILIPPLATLCGTSRTTSEIYSERVVDYIRDIDGWRDKLSTKLKGEQVSAKHILLSQGPAVLSGGA